MQTHRDDDVPNNELLKALFEDAQDPTLAALEERAAEMVAAGESELTAGKPGEEPLDEQDIFGVRMQRLPDDELCLRVSIGKASVVSGDFRYLVFRGDPEEVASLITRANNAMQAYLKKTAAKEGN